MKKYTIEPEDDLSVICEDIARINKKSVYRYNQIIPAGGFLHNKNVGRQKAY